MIWPFVIFINGLVIYRDLVSLLGERWQIIQPAILFSLSICLCWTQIYEEAVPNEKGTALSYEPVNFAFLCLCLNHDWNLKIKATSSWALSVCICICEFMLYSFKSSFIKLFEINKDINWIFLKFPYDIEKPHFWIYL